MAAVSGNKYTLALAKQTAKGSPASAATYKLKLTGGDVAPNRQIVQLAETDGSRQQGKSVVVGASVPGNPEFYLRPDDFGLVGYGVLGAIATTGAGADKTHTLTPADSGPYFTGWKAIGGTVLVDKYSDIRVTALRVRGQAGQPLTYGVDLVGLTAAFGATDDVASVVVQDPLVYPQVTVTKAGAAPGTVESFELNIENGGQTIQGDKQLGPFDYVWGALLVSGSLTMLFESDADYRKFHTGTSGGTAWGTTIFTESLSILAQVTGVLNVEFVMAGVAYREYPVPPDPGGGPIRVTMGFASQPQPLIADYLKIVVKNQVAAY